jgi:preprotein translocase subunit SecG
MTFSPLLAALINALLGWALLLLSVFLILLILVQRGRGGGLTGALGGPGGQSAFGTKAGDLFTRITSFVALGWIALCAFTMWQIGSRAPSAITPDSTISASPAEQTSATTDMIDLGTLGGQEAAPTTDEPPAEPATDGAASPVPSAAESADTGTEDAVESAPVSDSANP